MAGAGPDKALRVLHCPNNVAGNPAALARAEREVGLRSTAVSVRVSTMGYGIDEALCPHDASAVQQMRKRMGLLLRALRDVDVVHFNFGDTLMPMRRPAVVRQRGVADTARAAVERVLWMKDLPLLKAAGKVIAVTYQGDDARQGDFAAAHFAVNASEHVPPGYYSSDHDELKRAGIARFDRYADLIYALNPDLLHVLPHRARFLPYASVYPGDWRPSPPLGSPPVILHAPTHRGVKGTDFILAAVDRLRAEGAAFEFVLVEGLQYAEARALYERADLLVDQVLLGWYGALAVELMALGKPVACYLRDEDLALLPEAMRAELPVLHVTPTTVYEFLRRFLDLPITDRVALGARSRRYAEAWHDPVRIATRLSKDYRAAFKKRRGGAVRSGGRNRVVPQRG